MEDRDKIIRQAIIKRTKIQFRYAMKNMIVDPYFSKQNSNGKQILYGKAVSKNEIEKFDYDKIIDVKLLHSRKFSPIIPITQLYEKKT